MTLFAFYGTFTSNQPGHRNLAGARLLERTKTAARYRLWFVDGMWPALIPADEGVSIECELYEVNEEMLLRLADLEPPGWGRGPLELADGGRVEAFIADPALAQRGEDISSYGSWPAYARALSRLK